MNVVEISGRLTRDPDLRMLGDRRFPICTMNVAVDDATGRWNRETKKTEIESGFYQVELFGSYGEAMHNLLNKGDEVYVKGSLSQWVKAGRDGEEGERRTRIRAEIVIPKTGAATEAIPAPAEPLVDEERAMEEPF